MTAADGGGDHHRLLGSLPADGWARNLGYKDLRELGRTRRAQALLDYLSIFGEETTAKRDGKCPFSSSAGEESLGGCWLRHWRSSALGEMLPRRGPLSKFEKEKQLPLGI